MDRVLRGKADFLETASTDFFAASSATPCALASATIDMPILSVYAAWCAASMVHTDQVAQI